MATEEHAEATAPGHLRHISKGGRGFHPPRPSLSRRASGYVFLKPVELDSHLSPAQLKASWDVYDKDQRGSLEQEQGVLFFKEYATRQGLEDVDLAAETLFQRFDTNGDGSILFSDVLSHHGHPVPGQSTRTPSNSRASLSQLSQKKEARTVKPMVIPEEGEEELQTEGGTDTDIATEGKTAQSSHIPRERLKDRGLLGAGTFALVNLVEDEVTHETFALKAMYKALLKQIGNGEQVRSEREVMLELSHPFLIKLHETYQDETRIFLRTELVLGGELLTIMDAKETFDEEMAKFYAASVVSALAYLHSKSVVYRDLKPENILLDQTGYLKICDFGLAKFLNKIPGGKTFTMCGTPDYLAPEVISQNGQDLAVDWWTLGILIYEMLVGKTPFVDDNPYVIYQKILKEEVVYPDTLSPEAKELISRLLDKSNKTRLGVNGAEEVKAMAWFQGVDFDALCARKLPAPVVPKIDGNLDTSNFNEVDTSYYEEMAQQHYDDKVHKALWDGF